eukprot:1161814-Pelagomonas_calceolata.AAC.5
MLCRTAVEPRPRFSPVAPCFSPLNAHTPPRSAAPLLSSPFLLLWKGELPKGSRPSTAAALPFLLPLPGRSPPRLSPSLSWRPGTPPSAQLPP